MAQRPKTVPIVAGFLFADTAVAGGSLLFPGTLLDRLWELNKPGAAAFRTSGSISGVLLLLLGAGTFSAAVGLLQCKQWAWWFAVVLFAINGFGDVGSLVVTGDWPRGASGVAIACAFLSALSRYPVRRYFKHDRESL